jgi:hypothetical protein
MLNQGKENGTTQRKLWFSLYHNFGRSSYMFGHCNNLNVNANMVLGLFYDVLPTAVVM